MNTAKGKDALKERRERALSRRREELRKWIEPVSDIDEDVLNLFNRQAKIDRTTKDIENLERKLGMKT